MIRIIARRIPWPSLRDKRDRSPLRLRWDALTEDGKLLFAATEYPMAEGAYALLSLGIDPETLVTMRHEGSDQDSFAPMPLRILAAQGAKRAEGRARIAEIRLCLPERTAISASGVG